MNEEELIKKCFELHKRGMGEIKFTFEEYRSFWLKNKPNKVWKLINRDKSEIDCTIVYYPLPYYKDLRACVSIENKEFRETPIYYLK